MSNTAPYLEDPLPPKTKKKATKKMSEKEVFELPPEKGPKTINIRVKTIIITTVLITSHALAFWAGVQAPGRWDRFVDGLVEARTAQAAPVTEEAAPKSETEAPQVKTNQ